MSKQSQQNLYKGRDKRNAGWFWIHNDYLNGYAKYFGPVGTAIYVSLCRHADNDTQQCFPAQELIAEELNISETTVKKYIRLFKEYNLIDISRERDEKGIFKNNIYSLLDKTEWKTPRDTSLPVGKMKPRDTKEPLGGYSTQSHLVPPNNTHINNTNSVSKSETPFLEVKELFDYYLDQYQKKISNKKPLFNWGACTKLVKPHLKTLGLQRLKELLDAYLNSNDKFYKDNAYSLSCFLSIKILHKLHARI